MGIGLKALALGAAIGCCGAAHAQRQAEEVDPRLPHGVRDAAEPGAPIHPDIRVRQDRTLTPPNASQRIALPFVGDVAVAVGGLSVTDSPRHRTHMEADPAPANIRRRERGIGGLGLRLSF